MNFNHQEEIFIDFNQKKINDLHYWF